MTQTQPKARGVRLGWWCLRVGLLGLIAAYLSAMTARAGVWPALLLALSIPTATVGVTLIAIGRRAPVALVVALVTVHALVAVGLALAVPGPFALAGVFGAVPRTTVLVALAVGLVPLLLLPVLYVVTFASDLSDATLSRVRDVRRSS